MDCSLVSSTAQIQILPIIQTAVGPCCLRNLRPFVIKCTNNAQVSGAECPGELILGDPLLLAVGTNVDQILAHCLEQYAHKDFEMEAKTEPEPRLSALSRSFAFNFHAPSSVFYDDDDDIE